VEEDSGLLVAVVVAQVMLDQLELAVALVVLMPVQVMEVVVVMHLVELDLVVADQLRICHQELHKEQGMVVPVLLSLHTTLYNPTK
tara:strand:- start:38 stop:295 length:258 start_codon:yes stop_codon:yes gene_type:complete